MMVKVLRILVVLILLAAGAALYFSYELYRDRELIRGRMDKMERTLVDVNQKLAAAKDPHIALLEKAVDPVALKDVAAMDAQVETLRSVATARYEDLDATYNTLKQTRDKLSETETTLAQTKQELDDARTRIVSLKETFAQREADLASANQRVDEVTGQINATNEDITRQKAEVAERVKRIEELNDDILTLDVMLGPYRDMLSSKTPMPLLSGKVIETNPAWNFVILDVGRMHGVKVNGELIVHRGDTYVGKVRIVDVRQKVSIANVRRDWLVMPIEAGDLVFTANIETEKVPAPSSIPVKTAAAPAAETPAAPEPPAAPVEDPSPAPAGDALPVLLPEAPTPF